jgi:hypothetical protein
LSSEGLIAGSGCQALLASLPIELAGTEQPSVTVVDVTQAVPDAPELSEPEEMGYSMRAPEDFVTARQCLGNATTTPAAPVSTWRLTVQQAEGRRGVVTSTPSGISCGTGLDICAADFPRGSRVTLRAEDPSRFLNWGSTCDENTGGEQPTCVVLLNADRTVQADFRPRAPTGRFTLSIEIQGPGSVQAGQINCREDNLPENCAQEFGQGALIEIGAFPTQDWLGSGEDASFLGWSGDPECTALGTRRSGLITLDRNVHCIAPFRAPNLHLIRISVFGGGVVSDDPPRPSGSAAFECREGQVGGGCQARFPSTTMVPLRATPNFGQRFVGWGGDCASLGSNPRINVEVADNMNCTATFEQATTPQRLNVIYSRGAPNRIIESTPAGIRCFDGSGSDCEELYVPGTDVVLRANFPGTVWSGCDSLFTDTNGITACHMLMDQSPRTAHATFPPF